MTATAWAYAVCWFVGGAVLGSFLTVAGIRVPVRRSVVRPPSACPDCGERIRGIDLVPLFGWLIRRGRCRHCRHRISPVYPLMEGLAGLAFSVLFVRHGSIAEWAAGLVLVSLLIALTVSDLRYRLLPNRFIYPAFAAALLYRAAIHPLPVWQYAAGLLAGGGMLWLVSWYFLRMGRPAMGGGDIKLMALLGLLLGAEQILLILLLSSVLGLAAGLALMAGRRMSAQSFLPFGPFISLAAIVSWIWGARIVDAYVHLFTAA